ncbi:hypothetical protein Sango_1687900 [Sesamum angolense]|uniref:Uncharacterized protein n=1 Tax=Sesamum angolense TaxID=2727404 RepID=A0AAE1WL26_9LAMI|nr:hypothetical protein Sango_1687900 [Sesamum angolense]
MAATAATSASLLNSSKQIPPASGRIPGPACLSRKLKNMFPTWADSTTLGRAPVYWKKTMNGLLQLLLQFQVPRAWRNRPIEFFTEGLAQELSIEGACEEAIFPDKNVVITRCAMIGNLTLEGGDRCNLDLVLGCTDPSSPMFNPLATVDDGSCPPYSDSED